MRASRFYASAAVFTVFAFYRTPDCPKEQFYFVRATVARGLNEPTSPTPGGRSQIKMGIWDGIAQFQRATSPYAQLTHVRHRHRVSNMYRSGYA
jgi:hypothetical protein